MSNHPNNQFSNKIFRIPDTRRLPLRDAVEKRPAPDEPLSDQDLIELSRNTQNSYFYPQQTWYNPGDYFRGQIIGHPQPYRLDNQRFFHYSKGRDLFKEKYSEIVESFVPKPRIICYVQASASYRKEPLTFRPEDVDPFACTHIIYAFASLDPHNFNMISNDDEFDIVQGGYLAVTGLKRLNPDLKVLISVGESRELGAHRFSSMVASATRRRDFIKSAIGLIEQYGFDGIDIHWQYPGAEELGGHPNDREHLTYFLEELREIFDNRNWLISLAVPASRFRVEAGFDPEAFQKFVDFVNLQAYDFQSDRGDEYADHPSNLWARPQDQDLDIFYNVVIIFLDLYSFNLNNFFILFHVQF